MVHGGEAGIRRQVVSEPGRRAEGNPGYPAGGGISTRSSSGSIRAFSCNLAASFHQHAPRVISSTTAYPASGGTSANWALVMLSLCQSSSNLLNALPPLYLLICFSRRTACDRVEHSSTYTISNSPRFLMDLVSPRPCLPRRFARFCVCPMQ